MLKAFFARRRDRKTRTLVAMHRMTGRAFNPFTEQVISLTATLRFYQTEGGVRSVEATDDDLLNHDLAMAWIEWGSLPTNVVRCA